MTSPLDNLTGPGRPLVVEPPDADEFAGLKRGGLARLKDAGNTSNSSEGRFDLAYNAAHALCLAALRWHGYRPRNRYIVFQALPHTLGLGPEVWRVPAKCHDMRNRSEYEGEYDVDDRLVAQKAMPEYGHRVWMSSTSHGGVPGSGMQLNHSGQLGFCSHPHPQSFAK